MFSNKEGKKIPEITFRTRGEHEWIDVSSSELFKGKNVILFSLPGAFTPTCSSSHVPRYNQLADTFKANGIDEIVCISVNDAFVMNEWKEEQRAENISFIPDGNGEFTDAMGLLVDKDDLGFGKRSWRYSMLVKDGVIAKMFIEPELPGDPFNVSDADTMLEFVAPNIDKPLNVSVFSRRGCAYCSKAKGLLKEAGIEFEELLLNRDFTDRTLRAISAVTTFPQIFIDGQHIGGADALEEWFERKKAA
jgi:glutaredoxin-like protein